jgi:alpha-L-arabinofuranosidase
MNLKGLVLGTAIAATALTATAQDKTITVQANKLGAKIPSTMYGIFFEDINYGADGGLYAELIMNRSFEFPNNYAGWDISGKVSLHDDGPFEKNPHYVRLEPSGHTDKFTMIENHGFIGIGLKQNAEYRFSVWARCPQGGSSKIWIDLVDDGTLDDDQKLGNGSIEVSGTDWKKYTVTLKSKKTIDKASLRIWADSKNTTDFDHVSLFPVDTYKGHENGLRKDLAEALEDLKPGIFRFPGGCIVEGTDLNTRYQWKNTVGPVENRPLNENRWHYTFTHRYYPNYFQSYGLGFFEYFQLSEEIGAEPLPVLNVGMACQFQNNGEKFHVDYDKLDEYIQDCIDLVEFANGSVDTKWGKLRAEMGHPAPFNMKYLGIGNEQWDTLYFNRLKQFLPRVRKACPGIKIIGTSGPDSEGKMFELGWDAMTELKADLVDEHFYRNEQWFKNSMNRYDSYNRKGPKVFAGEYACHGKGKKYNRFGSSIYEAAFMTNIEKNADIVEMATYAPLFAHVEGWQWRPDMIWYNNLKSVKTCSYYVQQMYSLNKGTNVLSTKIDQETPKGEDGVFTSAVWDANSKSYIVKVINTTNKAQEIKVVLNGAKKLASTVEVTSLASTEMDKDNTVEEPNNIVPVTSTISTSGNGWTTTLPATTFAVYKVKKN